MIEKASIDLLRESRLWNDHASKNWLAVHLSGLNTINCLAVADALLLILLSSAGEPDDALGSSAKFNRPSSSRQNPPDFDEQAALIELPNLDPETLTGVHNRFYSEIYRYARYRLPDQRTAEDVAAEVFLRLVEAVHSGRGPRQSIRGWLMGTAANLVNDVYRKQYKQSSEALSDQLADSLPSLTEAYDYEEQLEAVLEAMLRLTPDQQHVLALRFGAEYSLEETAKSMGKKVNAVKQLQFRALASLRKMLAEGD